MMHDCIGDMAEPLYGFVTKIDLVDDESCEFNITCDANGNKIQSNLDHNNLTPDRSYHYHTPLRFSRRNHYQPIYNNVSRQTGEEFAASGPPRCRVRRDPSNRCRN